MHRVKGDDGMTTSARNWAVAVVATAALAGAATQVFSEAPKGRVMTTTSSESGAPTTLKQDVRSERRQHEGEGRFSEMKKVLKDLRPRACTPAKQTAAQSSWPARGEPAVTICPF
jgi:hypothetical protein